MPSLEVFQTIAEFAPHQLYRFGMDWNEQLKHGEKSVNIWEEREPGSLKAVMNAYGYIIPLIKNETIFNLEHIKNIHKYCTEGVRLDTANMVASDFSGEFRGFGKWRGGFFGAFRLTKLICTVNGLDEILKAQQRGDCHIEDIFNNPMSRDYIEKELQKEGVTISGYRAGFTWNDFHTLSKNIERLNTPKLDPQDKLYAFFKMTQPPELSADERKKLEEIVKKELERWQRNFVKKMEEVLTEFYQEMEITDHSDREGKLVAIVKFVNRFELLHPFWDGNTRTFCMVLLNALLMQNDFMPALIDDPNKFDGFSIKELVDLVKQGMKRTEVLYNYIAKGKMCDPKNEEWIKISGNKQEKLATFSQDLIKTLRSEQETLRYNIC